LRRFGAVSAAASWSFAQRRRPLAQRKPARQQKLTIGQDELATREHCITDRLEFGFLVLLQKSRLSDWSDCGKIGGCAQDRTVDPLIKSSPAFPRNQPLGS
jgi:hypothetical protein